MNKLLLPALLALLLCPLAAGAQQLQLDRTNPKRDTVGALQFLGAVVVPPGPDKIGGLSAMQVSADGKSLLALADVGRLFRGQLSWDANGKLKGVTFAKGVLLLDENGKPPQTRARFDSESLTQLANGDYLVGYERDHRIERYTDLARTPQPFDQPQGLGLLPRNLGLESLTALPDGRVLAIAEGPGEDGLHPTWLWQEGHWRKISYRAEGGLNPSDAASLPNGDVLVLERGFNLFYGFRCRVVRVAGASIGRDEVLQGTTLAMLESPILSENFEALGVQPLDGERARLLLLSDNNFNAAQQTILAAFEINFRAIESLTP